MSCYPISYYLKDIVNTDEFGLFYQCVPNKTFHFNGEKCSGEKQQRRRRVPQVNVSRNVYSEPLQITEEKLDGSEIFDEWIRAEENIKILKTRLYI